MLTIFFIGCFDIGNDSNEVDRCMRIDFEPSTNTSYLSYLENEYNISIDHYGGKSNSSGSFCVSDCVFYIEEELAQGIIRKLEKEEQIDRVYFYDLDD